MTTWQAYIDWDRDYSFAGDDIFQDVIQMTFKLGMGRAYQNICDESTCTITVDNSTGKYNPENSASPLYGKLLPQRPVKIMADDTTTLWRGWVEKIAPEWRPAGPQTGKTQAVIYCIGAKQFLQQTQVNLPLQENKRGNEIIADVLRRVVLPPALDGNVWILGKVGYSELGMNTRLASESDYSDLETGVLTFPYYGDIVSDSLINTGLTIIKDMTDAERGRFFFDRLGKAIWWNQDHLMDDSINDYTVDSDGLMGIRPFALEYRYGEGISNSVQVSFYPRSGAGATITLWSLENDITIAPGGSIEFEAPYTDSNNLRAGATNVASANISFSAGAGTVTVSAQADRAIIAVQNTGSVDAVLHTLDLTGQALTAHNRMVVTAKDNDSIAAFGLRGEIKLDLKALEDYVEASEVAEFELRRRKDPMGEVGKITLLNKADGIGNAEQLTWKMGDRLRVYLADNYHDQSYFIMGEEHQISAGGQAHKTIYTLEPAIITRLANYHKSNHDENVNLQCIETRTKTRLAQQFKVSASTSVGSVRLWLKKVGSPTGSLTAKIFSNHLQGGTWYLGTVGSSELGVTTVLAADADYPDVQVTNGISNTVLTSGLEATFRYVLFTFPTPPSLVIGTKYWIVLSTTDSASASNYIQWGADGSSPSYADGYMMSEQGGGSWKLENKDAIFEVYEA